MSRIEKNGLQIEPVLYDFLVKEALPGSGIDADTFFAGFSKIVHDLFHRDHGMTSRQHCLLLHAHNPLDQYVAFAIRALSRLRRGPCHGGEYGKPRSRVSFSTSSRSAGP